MKFYNRQPKLRDTWTKVKLPKARIEYTTSTFANGYTAHWPVISPMQVLRGYSAEYQHLKYWCQQQPGGRFYQDKLGTWYFEREQDASWFLLKWS